MRLVLLVRACLVDGLRDEVIALVADCVYADARHQALLVHNLAQVLRVAVNFELLVDQDVVLVRILLFHEVDHKIELLLDRRHHLDDDHALKDEVAAGHLAEADV